MSNFAMVSTGKETLGGGLAPTGKIGYVAHDRLDVAKLCEQIEAPDIGLDTRSLPDVWAQLLKFHQTLTGFDPDDRTESNSSRAAFEAVRVRWRGLLALVVLRKELGLNGILTLDRLFLKDQTADGAGKFTRIAFKLLPDSFRKRDYGWSDIHAITFRGVTIGCTSPLTFVCPSASLPTQIGDSGFSWFASGVFSDPLPYLTGPYLHCLRDWLSEAIDRLPPANPRKDWWPDYLATVKAGDLRRELSVFKEQVTARLNGSESVSHQVQLEHDPAFSAADVIQGTLQSLMSTSNVVTVEHARASSFRLLPAPGATPAKPLLLIGPTFTKLPGFQQGEIEVLKGVTLNEAIRTYNRGEHHRLRTLNFDVCELYSAEEVFCDKLFVARVNNAFPGAHNFPSVAGLERRGDASPIAPILPLRSEFLDHFTPKYLLENVEFRGSESEITVALRVTLNYDAPGDRKAVVSLSKTYRTSDGSMIVARLPEVRIWPHYSEADIPGWKTWYAYYNDLNDPGHKLNVTPHSKYTAPAAPGKRAQVPIIDASDKVKGIEITPCSSFPAVFVCKLSGDEIGVLLAKHEELKRGERSEPWEVGIDFGTAGTSVFYAKKNGTPSRLELEPHVLALTLAGASESYRFFLPTKKENTNGLLSIFKDFRGIHPESGKVEPFTEGHISFIDRSRSVGENEDLAAEGICADMKWGDALEQARGVAFLEQLCLLTALQVRVAGGTQARWAFSYPLSFSSHRRSNFRTHWENSVRFALDTSGLKPSDGEEGMRFRNESACSAKYARHVSKANLGGGAIVLDIGGGSTDLSVWRREGRETKAVHNTSVRFAGRDLLQFPLWNKPEILGRLASTDEGRSFAKVLAGNRALRDNKTIFFSQIDSFFNLEGESLLQTLSRQAGEREIKDFVGILALGMTGLFFYTGLLLRRLAAENQFESRLPDVFVCGNGGKILYWLGFGRFREREPAENALLQALLAGTGFPPEARGHAKVSLSKEPKSEAAYGLLVDPEQEESLSDDPLRVVAGEDFWLGDKPFDAFSIVPYEEFHEDPYHVAPNPPMLQAFLKATGRPPLPSRTLQDVVAETNEQLAHIATCRINLPRDEKDALREHEQPIFIVLLNELIKNAARHWAGGQPAWWL